jgi:hypothetical protein
LIVITHGELVNQMSNIYGLHQHDLLTAQFVLSKSIDDIYLFQKLMQEHSDYDPDKSCDYCSISGGELIITQSL